MTHLLRDFFFNHPGKFALIGGGLLTLSLVIHTIMEKMKGEDSDFISHPIVVLLYSLPSIIGLTIGLFLVIYDKIFWGAFVFISFICFGFPLIRIISFFENLSRKNNNRKHNDNQEYDEPDERDLEA